MRLIPYARRQLKDLPWLLIGVLLLARVGIAEANWIPTGSMEPTLPVGDFLIIDKTAYGLSLPFMEEVVAQWKTPQRGDIVTFDPKHTDDRLIKRVIGVAGDVILVRNGVTFLNGQALAQTIENGFIRESLNDVSYLTTPAYPAQFGPVKVPEGQLFVMGDNRSNSADSRYWGFLPTNRVKGKAQYRLFTTAWLGFNSHENSRAKNIHANFGNLY